METNNWMVKKMINKIMVSKRRKIRHLKRKINKKITDRLINSLWFNSFIDFLYKKLKNLFHKIGFKVKNLLTFHANISDIKFKSIFKELENLLFY